MGLNVVGMFRNVLRNVTDKFLKNKNVLCETYLEEISFQNIFHWTRS